MLLIHRDTLRTLQIGFISPGGSRHLFHASDFPNLEFLQLSRYQMSQDLRFSRSDADALLAPRLQRFEWDFSIHDRARPFREGCTDFGEREEQWLRSFARVAIERSAALKSIRVAFSPEERDWPRGQSEYPWDRLDSIRVEVQPQGITLTWSTPSITKEAWLKRNEGTPVEVEFDSIP